MIAVWKDFLLQRSEEWNLPRGDDWRFLLHNNYQPHYSNMNVLWFHGSAPFPRVVTKVFREPRVVEREFANLVEVYGVIPRLVPRPLHFGLEDRFWTLWMEGVPGARLRASDHYSPALLRSLGDTVLSMHLAMRKERSAFAADRYRRVVSEPLETLARFGQSPAVREGCAALKAKIPPGWVERLPAIPQHGDLFFGNLLAHRGGWHILDWETYGITDLPLYDLLTLVLSLLLARGANAQNWPARLVEYVPHLIRAYSKKLKLSSEDVRLLLPLSLANWFHLQWEDGRSQFAETMYRTIDRYFARKEEWERMLLSA